jgi:hypothetical protein
MVELPQGSPLRAAQRRYLATNISVALGGGVLTVWLAITIPQWPRTDASALTYLLLSPFLLVPPLWALSSLYFAGRILIAGWRGAFAWVCYAACIALNAFALAIFLPVFVRLAGV